MIRCQSNTEFNTFAVGVFKSPRSTFWHKTTVESTNQSTAALDKRRSGTVKQPALPKPTKCELKRLNFDTTADIP